MADISETVALILDMQTAADMLLGKGQMDCMRMHQAFLQQYKQIHGSYKVYIGKPEYLDLMNKRDDCLLQQINDAIEAKVAYEKDYGAAIKYASQMGCM